MYEIRTLDSAYFYTISGQDILKNRINPKTHKKDFGWDENDNTIIISDQDRDLITVGKYKIYNKYLPIDNMFISLDISNVYPDKLYLITVYEDFNFDIGSVNLELRDDYDCASRILKVPITVLCGELKEISSTEKTNIEINKELINEQRETFNLDYYKIRYIKEHITENLYNILENINEK